MSKVAFSSLHSVLFTLLFAALTTFLMLSPARVVLAQESAPGPVYVVQSGDTLYSIAIRFGVTVDDLIKANNLVNPDLLSAGNELVIPGLEGLSGKLMTETISLGETLRTLSIRHQINREQILRLNRITSPMEVFAGASLIIPEDETETLPQGQFLLDENGSILQLAAAHNQNPWLLTELNHMQGQWDLLPGEPVFAPPSADGQVLSLISPLISDFKINSLPLIQGFTTSIQISTTDPVEINGSLAGWPLRFFQTGPNSYTALQGVHAMTDPGIYPLILEGTLADGTSFFFEQMVVLQSAGYSREDILGVDPATVDPAVTQPENDQVIQITTPATAQKQWDGLFLSPGYDPQWITSWYGTRRSYNDSPYAFFHTGVDYGGGTGLPIKSPAAGTIVFAGPLTVRGNATIIDHGWGIYSGFWHQSEMHIKVGDRVEAGQIIGLVGGTGRVTGPHLHWELWVNGVQVNPLPWLQRVYP
jgi:murein DD-endopeptidase MepM/ murein hydrolase activator NlpD